MITVTTMKTEMMPITEEKKTGQLKLAKILMMVTWDITSTPPQGEDKTSVCQQMEDAKCLINQSASNGL